MDEGISDGLFISYPYLIGITPPPGVTPLSVIGNITWENLQ